MIPSDVEASIGRTLRLLWLYLLAVFVITVAQVAVGVLNPPRGTAWCIEEETFCWSDGTIEGPNTPLTRAPCPCEEFP